MPIIETKGSMSSQGYGQFARSGAAANPFIEDVFSTTLYTGTGAAQSIANGIALGTGATSAGWFANIFGSTTTSLVGVAVDSTGNAYACGYTVVSSANVATLAKFSPTGAVIWQTSLPPSGSATATIFYDAAIGPSGDVYVCGQINIPGGFGGYLVVKYNSSGVLQWQFNFNSTSQQAANAIAVDSSDFVYVTGDSGGTSFFTTIKLNSSGALQWQVRYSGEQGLYGRGIAVDASGNVHVVGTEQYSSGEDVLNRAVILKYNTSGTLLWRAAVGQASDSDFYGSACALDASGNVYVVAHGNTLSTSVLSKFNSSGNPLWQTRYSTSALQGAGIATSSSGDSYITVRTGGALNNGFIAKIDTSGALQWQRRIQTSVFNAPTGIALSGADSLWVVGGISTTIASGLVARLPVDGSGTGAYNLNGLTLSYAAGSELSGNVVRSGSTAGASSAGVLVSNTLTSTNTPTFLAAALTPLAQGAGRGGLVWMKSRSATTDHALYDTTRGATFDLASNTTAAQTTQAQGLTAFLGSGFSIGSLAKLNNNNVFFSAWTFAEQPKFFDIVTYTGNGTPRTIAHNLGSVPGCIIVKRVNNVGGWQVYHRSNLPIEYLTLNTTDVAQESIQRWNDTAPTASVFSLGIDGSVNDSGGSYVAYLFAHNAGGFGAAGTDNVISCGSYNGNGSATGPTVTLGWEPQWLLIKRSNSPGTDWVLIDNMRGLVVGGNDAYLLPNSSTNESLSTRVTPTATGFQVNSTSPDVNSSDLKYIYIAIRRGPMRTPTSGASVFMPVTYTGNGLNNRLVDTNIAPDMVWMRLRTSTAVSGMVVGDRLRAQPYLLTGSTAAEVTSANAFDQQRNSLTSTEFGTAFSAPNGVYVGSDATASINTGTSQLAEAFRRAPGFFDVVCYTGTGANLAVNHNLGVAPEMMIAKRRNSDVGSSWGTAHIGYGSPWARFNGLLYDLGKFDEYVQFYQNPTATQFFVTTEQGASGGTYVAYLFASCPGVSKVGSYTGTGSTVQVNCGFTTGARFVLIKRADAAGEWYVWDSARGIVAGTDPYLRINSTSAEVTSTDWVDTLATGFEVSNAGSNFVNENGGTYLFLAIA